MVTKTSLAALLSVVGFPGCTPEALLMFHPFTSPLHLSPQMAQRVCPVHKAMQYTGFWCTSNYLFNVTSSLRMLQICFLHLENIKVISEKKYLFQKHEFLLGETKNARNGKLLQRGLFLSPSWYSQDIQTTQEMVAENALEKKWGEVRWKTGLIRIQNANWITFYYCLLPKSRYHIDWLTVEMMLWHLDIHVTIYTTAK